jgi:hypothetical protein
METKRKTNLMVLCFSLLIGSVFGLAIGPNFSVQVSLASCLFFGLTFGLLASVSLVSLRVGSYNSLIFALSSGVASGLVFGLRFGPTPGLFFGLISGLALGLVFALGWVFARVTKWSAEVSKI